MYILEVKEFWIKIGGDGGMWIYMIVDLIDIYKGDLVIYLDDSNINI